MRRGLTSASSALALTHVSIATTMLAALVAMSLGCAAPAAATEEEVLPTLPAASGLETIPASRLCVTDGHVDPTAASTLAVDVGAMRGVVAGDRSDAAEIAFTYAGPSSVEAPLADGELRRQIGIKLRAQDSCNVVYVMWHIAPTSGVFVQVKRNPGQSTHAECADRGYVDIAATAGVQPPAIAAGEHHTLRADLAGTVLTVLADGAVAWQGEIPTEASAFDGPVGIRSDNGQFDFGLRVPGGTRLARCPGTSLSN